MYHSRVDKHWYSIELSSYSERDEDKKGAKFTLIGFGHYLQWRLPDWVCRPYWVDVHSDIHNHSYRVAKERTFGLCKFENHFTIRYGLQEPHDWPEVKGIKEKCKGWFIPWMDTTFVAWRLFDLEGNLYAIQKGWVKLGSKDDEDFDKARETVPKIQFKFKDNYDEEEGIATCFVEEREWHKGASWCKWLKYFTNPMIRRNLDISYNIEVGNRKGSWKGGVIGCGCDIISNESLEQSFIRHCEKENLTYLGNYTLEKEQLTELQRDLELF